MKNILAGTGCALALASLMISYPQASVQAPIFEKSPQVIQGASRTWGSAAADLDGDGDLDIVLRALEPGPLVMINEGNGRFRASEQMISPISPERLVGGYRQNQWLIDSGEEDGKIKTGHDQSPAFAFGYRDAIPGNSGSRRTKRPISGKTSRVP